MANAALATLQKLFPGLRTFFGARVDAITVPAAEWASGGGAWCDTSAFGTYASLYRTQPAVRTVISFLADNVAQVGLHVYRRVSDTDRVRVYDHPLAQLLRRPNSATTTFRLFRDTVDDLGIYANAYWLKLREGPAYEVVRIPADEITPYGRLVPAGYRWCWPDGGQVDLEPADLVHFRMYDPRCATEGLSPLETLRRILAEDQAATVYRAQFWNNAARLSGVIERPRDAARWTAEQRQIFRAEWQDFYTGANNAGKTVVLEDGMSFKEMTGTARDAQLIEARKLTREEVAAAYHVPPAMVGIVEAQGYGSLREQHKALYQDTLGPWFSMIEQELMLQLLPDFSDVEKIYVEFNIAQKLKGSFEEQADALAGMVGSPFMTRNEARALLNLSRINDPAFDVPVTRLDVLQGQQAKTAPPPAPVTARYAADDLPITDVVIPAPPDPRPAIAALGDRLAGLVDGLPSQLAATLREAMPAPPPSPVSTRPLRDASGRIVALEDHDADGMLIARRAVIRDGAGRVREIASTPLDPDGDVEALDDEPMEE